MSKRASAFPDLPELQIRETNHRSVRISVPPQSAVETLVESVKGCERVAGLAGQPLLKHGQPGEPCGPCWPFLVDGSRSELLSTSQERRRPFCVHVPDHEGVHRPNVGVEVPRIRFGAE